MNIAREPIVIGGALATIVIAVLTLTDVFGLTHTTKEQRDALQPAILAIVGGLWVLLLAIRQFVTPTAAARLNEGTVVTTTDAAGTTTGTTKLTPDAPAP